MRIIVEGDSSVDLTHNLNSFGDAEVVDQAKEHFIKLSQHNTEVRAHMMTPAHKFPLNPCTFCQAPFFKSYPGWAKFT